MENDAKSDLRVHLGSGHTYWPGWVNVDLEADCDVNADVLNLPFEDNSVSEIQGIHVFEHLHRMDAPKALKEWKRILKKDGKLVLELPCLDKILDMFRQGEKNIRMTLMGLYGDPRYETDEMCHKWAWSISEIIEQLNASGFEAEAKEPYFHVKKRDMRIEAKLCQ